LERIAISLESIAGVFAEAERDGCLTVTYEGDGGEVGEYLERLRKWGRGDA